MVQVAGRKVCAVEIDYYGLKVDLSLDDERRYLTVELSAEVRGLVISAR
jgi:hypothetical protein